MYTIEIDTDIDFINNGLDSQGFRSDQSLSHVRLCNLMNSSTPGLPVHHQLSEFNQTHVHGVSDTVQPSHSLSFPSPFAANPSQHQNLFQWVNSSHEVAKVQGLIMLFFSSVHFSRSVVSDSLRPHESQRARPPCPSPTLRVHSDSRPSSQWCHPAISSSVVPFSSCPQSLPASESFPMS